MKSADNRYVVDERITPLPKSLTVDRFTTYCVTLAGFPLVNQLTVTEVKFTDVHGFTGAAGIFANVAVVADVLQALSLPFNVASTRP